VVTETANEIVIAAEPSTIFALASATERWPQLLPHYRFVRVLEGDDRRRIVEMAARRGAFPVRWTAEQTNDPDRAHIAFRHLRGWTRGMEVEWLFERSAAGTRVRIVHRLEFQFPVARDWLGRHVVSDFFIRDIAGKTLACMKRLAENGA
jgi:ribosome-associated toxin RatA of RatAB toxin-antitoxin module